MSVAALVQGWSYPEGSMTPRTNLSSSLCGLQPPREVRKTLIWLQALWLRLPPHRFRSWGWTAAAPWIKSGRVQKDLPLSLLEEPKAASHLHL